MSRKISVKIPVAGRIYPMTIDMDEEENIRRAAKEIDDSIKKLRLKYAVRDDQDLLAMTALEAVTKQIGDNTTSDSDKCKQEILNINKQLDLMLS